MRTSFRRVKASTPQSTTSSTRAMRVARAGVATASPIASELEVDELMGLDRREDHQHQDAVGVSHGLARPGRGEEPLEVALPFGVGLEREERPGVEEEQPEHRA